MNSQTRFRSISYCSNDPSGFLIFLMVVLMFVALEGRGQRLDIGDRVPDVKLTRMINSAPASLYDYRGKLVILDFWATWCAPCIALMPKTDSLQKVFDGKVQFLPVTYQSEAEVKRLLKRLPGLRDISLPMVVSDTTLKNLFPHKQLPHYVWIGPEGNVRAITDSRQVTAANITAMLDEREVDMEEKQDVILPYNRERPLMFNDVGIEEGDIHYSTMLTRYKPGLSMRTDVLRHADNSIKRITMTNLSIKSLFLRAYSSYDNYLTSNRVVLEVEDPSKLALPEFGSRRETREWMNANAYCYEIKVPERLSRDIFSIMRQDMDRLFPQYRASLEKRKVKCLALIRTSGEDKIRTKRGESRHLFDFTEARLRNRSLALLIAHLNATRLQHLDMPIVDATGYTSNVDIHLEGDLSDVATLRQELQAYDLDLVEREMEVEMLVVRGRNDE